MALEDIEIKNSAEVVKEMGEVVFDQLFGDEQPREQKQFDEAQSSHQEVPEDIPNASIRLDKMRQQRDDERQQRHEIEKRMAQMEGKMSVLDKGNDGEEAVDPTEYMDDTQKFLFNENKGLKDNISKLTNVVQGIQTEGSKKKLEAQENVFFENNPHLNVTKEKRAEFVDDMLIYLKDKPSIKSSLKSGEIKLSEVYGMYTASKPKSVKTSQVSNPDIVFSGHSDSVPVDKTQDGEFQVARRKALSILHDKDSTNKKNAADFLKNEITQDIVSQLEI